MVAYIVPSTLMRIFAELKRNARNGKSHGIGNAGNFTGLKADERKINSRNP
jgi:hypothetical protein